MSIEQDDVLRYIGLILALKNCETQKNDFEKNQFKNEQFVPWIVDNVPEVLQEHQHDQIPLQVTANNSTFLSWILDSVIQLITEDMNRYRGFRINVEKESESKWIYHWRKGKRGGSIRLTTEQLLKLTSDTCIKYINDNRLEVKNKSWY